MDMTPYLGPFVTALIAAGGTYVAVASRLATLEAKLDMLSKSVDKHNQVIERTYKLERDVKTAFSHIDDMRTEQHEMREDIHKLELIER